MKHKQDTMTCDYMIDRAAGCVVCESNLPRPVWTDVITEARF